MSPSQTRSQWAGPLDLTRQIHGVNNHTAHSKDREQGLLCDGKSTPKYFWVVFLLTEISVVILGLRLVSTYILISVHCKGARSFSSAHTSSKAELQKKIRLKSTILKVAIYDPLHFNLLFWIMYSVYPMLFT